MLLCGIILWGYSLIAEYIMVVCWNLYPILHEWLDNHGWVFTASMISLSSIGGDGCQPDEVKMHHIKGCKPIGLKKYTWPGQAEQEEKCNGHNKQLWIRQSGYQWLVHVVTITIYYFDNLTDLIFLGQNGSFFNFNSVMQGSILCMLKRYFDGWYHMTCYRDACLPRARAPEEVLP